MDEISFTVDPARDATDSIRGYVYQAYQSVFAWINLKENEALILEGAEDFDIHLGRRVEVTQVKGTTNNITLRTPSVVEAINNFWVHQSKNLDYEVSFRFLSTSNAGCERDHPFGDVSGIDYWRNVAASRSDIVPLRNFLCSLSLEQNLKDFLAEADDQVVLSRLIQKMTWDLGERSNDTLQSCIEDKLMVHGNRQSINTHHSRGVLSYLLKVVVDVLSTKGEKRLTYGSFLECFDAATMEMVPRSILQQRAEQSLSVIDNERLVEKSILSSALPLVSGAIRRSVVVESVSRRVNEHRVIFFHGSSGVGKTNLAALITEDFGGDWAWVGFRGIPPDQTRDMLSRAARELYSRPNTPLLVLDDLDFNVITRFERELIVLVFSAVSAGGLVLITGQVPPPTHLLPKLWLGNESAFQVPYFDIREVEELVKTHGLNDYSKVSEWAKVIWRTTSGHPQLVHARVRSLMARGWPPSSLNDSGQPEEVECVRKEARQRLLHEFPSEDARILAYRLSVVRGSFKRDIALSLGRPPPSISAPGAIFDTLVGPWIEAEGSSRFRISPLLAGAAINIFQKDDLLKIHETIVETILREKDRDPHTIETGFYHAITTRSEEAIVSFAMAIIETKPENMKLLSELMSWLPAMAKGEKEGILSDDPTIKITFCLAQYQIAASMRQKDACLDFLRQMESLIEVISSIDLRKGLEYSMYAIVLNTIDIHIAASTVIRLLSRIIDLSDEPLLAVALPRIEGYEPVQILMSYQAFRISGTDDLVEMVNSLEALPTPKREFLLKICATDHIFVSLLINRALWKDVSSQTFNMDDAEKKLSYCAEKFAAWHQDKLVSTCFVAQSVLFDEYRKDTDGALNIICKAIEKFPNDVNIVNQKGKVLYRAGRYRESREVFNSIKEYTDLSVIEQTVMLRLFGICAAKEGDWQKAADSFLLGAEIAAGTEIQKPMVAGLIADAAVFCWKAGEFMRSLELFAQSLTILAEIPFNDNLLNRHVHATVRHCVTWSYCETQKKPHDFYCPPSGTCSNQNPHEGMKDFVVKELAVTWQLLARTEKVLNLSVGIAEEAHLKIEGSRTLMAAVDKRSVAFDLFWRERRVEELIAALQDFFEYLECMKAIKKREIDVWSPRGIPPLPDGYWPTQDDNLAHFLLLGGIAASCVSPCIPLPLTRWKGDLAQRGALTNKITQLIGVLDGEHPGESLHEQAAGQLMHLRAAKAPALDDLWVACFQLLNAVVVQPLYSGPLLEEFVITKWRFALVEQKFAFLTPMRTCPAIEACCADSTLNGLAHVAAILETAAQGLSISLPQNVRDMLREIRNTGRFGSSPATQ
jgi:hypothetical protein